MPGPSPGLRTMSATSIKREQSEESIGAGGQGWGGRDRDSSSEGGGEGVPGENSGGLDPQLWHACAGGMVLLPPVGAKVIYFPQGHAEQAATPPEFPRILGRAANITCTVVSVNYLADTETDEVYARIRLQPEGIMVLSELESDPGDGSPSREKPASFAKTLTQSDANNGGGFSVPRYCAETIFPPLDYSIDPPVQTVLAKDVHGERWKFRHIYRGTPRRHLLTTGWSTFVNQKKLVAGDAIVFLRTASGELCVGVRRSMRGTGGADSSTWSAGSGTSHHRPNRWEVKGTESFSDFLGAESGGAGGGTVSSAPGAGGGGLAGGGVSRGLGTSNQGPGIGISGNSTSSFARNRARVTAKSVVEAASQAAAGQPFEVVYYPRASTAEFCVKSHLVKQALELTWYSGLRFKMAFETEDSSRISWFMGTVHSVQPADNSMWPKSPWRVLQVSWDEPDLLQGVSRVSPWQVEIVSTLPLQVQPYSIPKKKLRATQPSELNLQAPGLIGMPMALPNVFGPMNPWAQGLPIDEVPAVMQGVRHDRLYGLAMQGENNYRAGRFQGGIFTTDSFNLSDHVGRGGGDPRPGAFPLSDRGGNFSSLISSLSNVPQVDHGSAASLLVPGWTGGTQNRNTAQPFVLFGQAINPDPTKGQSHPHQALQQQHSSQHSGSSSSEGQPSLRHLSDESPGCKRSSPSSESNYGHHHHPEAAGKVRKYLSGFNNGNVADTAPAARESFKWRGEIKDRTGEKMGSAPAQTYEFFSHCKVFRDGEEVGRTIDLSQISSYEELFEKLGILFSLEKKGLLNSVVYKDSNGCRRNVGVEPYRNFSKAARRLMISSDSLSTS